MIDPFKQLRTDLEAAATRLSAPQRRRSWLPSRPLLLALAALTVTGTATATVVSLIGTDSAPLRGQFVGGSGPSAPNYLISMRPDLNAGHTGWCVRVQVLRGTTPQGETRGCQGVPPSQSPLIRPLMSVAGRRGIYAAIVTQRVAAMRLPDGRVVRAVSDPGLPTTMRAAVYLQPDVTDTSAFLNQQFKLLDADGNAIDTPPRNVRPTLAPTLRVRQLTTAQARRQPGSIIVRNPAINLGIRGQRILASSSRNPAFSVPGAFLSTASAIFDLDGYRMQAAYLVDAADPGRAAPNLPGQAAAAGLDLFTASDDLLARRSGTGWLVVHGTGADRRRRLIQALTIRR